MKRKTLIIACSLLMVIALVVTSCSTTVTSTATTTMPGGTVTVTATGPGTVSTQTVTNTVTQPPVTITNTTVVTGSAGAVVTITTTLPGQTVVNTVTVTGGTPSSTITVMNPQIEPTMVQRIPLSPRLSTVDGKKILFVDLTWGGPDGTSQFFKALKEWFTANHPTTELTYRVKAGSYFMDDKTTWQLVADSYDAMVIGISG